MGQIDDLGSVSSGRHDVQPVAVHSLVQLLSSFFPQNCLVELDVYCFVFMKYGVLVFGSVQRLCDLICPVLRVLPREHRRFYTGQCFFIDYHCLWGAFHSNF